MSFLQRPQQVALRRVLFHSPRWMGVTAGLYVIAVSVSGAALLFRPEMQAAVDGRFFDIPHAASALADPAVVITRVGAAYPGYRLSGIDWPTYRRDSFLAYVLKGAEFRTVFVHPVSAEVLGELPRSSWITWLQDVHFNLLSGPTGRAANGVGAASVLAICLTGLVIWWPGTSRWYRALRVDRRHGWKRVTWDLHSAAGFWLFGWLASWGLTGIEFAYPRQFRAAVAAVLPLTAVQPPRSTIPLAGGPSPNPAALVARARQALPTALIARLVYPSSDRAPYLVLMARDIHGDGDTSDEVSFYFDQYTGVLLERRDNERGPRTAGDWLMATFGPLHPASFAPRGAGGLVVKALWALIALGFPLLVVTGVLMWWNRIVNDR